MEQGDLLRIETSFLINDAFSRFSNATRAKAFEEFPEIKFQYIGASDNKTREVSDTFARHRWHFGQYTVMTQYKDKEFLGNSYACIQYRK